jgi:hypothetical protein
VLSFVIVPVRGNVLGVATRFIPGRKALGQQEPMQVTSKLPQLTDGAIQPPFYVIITPQRESELVSSSGFMPMFFALFEWTSSKGVSVKVYRRAE